MILILDDLKMIRELDSEDMYHKIIHLPEQILDAYENAEVMNIEIVSNRKIIKKIVICGMGGSAISGDIAVSCFQDLDIEVVKDYKIRHVDENTLVVILSYSGNTEESISCALQAKKQTSLLSGVTSGGMLADIFASENLWLKLKPDLPPRSAIGYLFFSLVKVLELFELISNQAEIVKKTVANLIYKANAISYNQPYEMNLAKLTAEQIGTKYPIIYATEPLFLPLANRWKSQINENAKFHAFFHTFPEMNHNEIEGWVELIGKQRFIPIFLTKLSQDEHYSKRVMAVKKLFDKGNIDYLEFYTEGESTIEQLFSLLYFGDMLSFYMAILMKVNPTTISNIDFLKKEIEQKVCSGQK